MAKHHDKSWLSSNEESEWLKVTDYRERNSAWLQISAEIAQHILEILEIRNWSRAELGRQLDVSPQQVSKIISGQANLRLSTIAKIQKVLGVKLITTRFAYPWKEHTPPEFRSAGLTRSYEREFLSFKLVGYSSVWTQPLGGYIPAIETQKKVFSTNKKHLIRAKSKTNSLQPDRSYN